MSDAPAKFPPDSAAARGLACCLSCGKLSPLQLRHCPRCGSRLQLRKPQSLQRCGAWLLTAVLLYLPANLYPIMATEFLGREELSTILGGVILLWAHGSYPIALVIFIASVLVPIAKILALAWLCLTVSRGHNRPSRLSALYQLTELVGRWSMVDVFVVAILVALIQLGALMSIYPGIAALAFAGVVIATMLAALSFDPRLIWDVTDFNAQETASRHE